METISLLWRFEDLACDWSENNEHSRHILGVHGFRSFTVMYMLMSSLALTCYFESSWSRDLSRDQELKIL